MQSPCLTTTCTDEWLEGLAFDTAANALATLADAHIEAELVALEAPCWTVICDGCGEELEDDEIRLHLPSAPDAETVAREVGGWTSPEGRRWFLRRLLSGRRTSDRAWALHGRHGWAGDAAVSRTILATESSLSLPWDPKVVPYARFQLNDGRWVLNG